MRLSYGNEVFMENQADHVKMHFLFKHRFWFYCERGFDENGTVLHFTISLIKKPTSKDKFEDLIIHIYKWDMSSISIQLCRIVGKDCLPLSVISLHFVELSRLPLLVSTSNIQRI